MALYRCGGGGISLVPTGAFVFADTTKVLVSSLLEDAGGSGSQVLSEDGVLCGVVSAKWTTAKSSSVQISIRSWVLSSNVWVSGDFAKVSVDSLAANKVLELNVGGGGDYPYGIYIPKGACLDFVIGAQTGGTRTLTNTLTIYGVQKHL